MLRKLARFSAFIFMSAHIIASVHAGIAIPKSDTTTISFNHDIRPIFSEHCYACHGPDEGKRKAGLRLDSEESAFKELKSGARAIVPGDLKNSALIERIHSTDP